MPVWAGPAQTRLRRAPPQGSARTTAYGTIVVAGANAARQRSRPSGPPSPRDTHTGTPGPGPYEDPARPVDPDRVDIVSPRDRTDTIADIRSRTPPGRRRRQFGRMSQGVPSSRDFFVNCYNTVTEQTTSSNTFTKSVCTQIPDLLFEYILLRGVSARC